MMSPKYKPCSRALDRRCSSIFQPCSCSCREFTACTNTNFIVDVSVSISVDERSGAHFMKVLSVVSFLLFKG